MNKKLFALISLVLIASFALAACGTAATPTEAPAEPVEPVATEAPAPTEAPVAEPVTIAFWEQEGEEVDVFIDQLLADFMAANPDITVERTHYENEALRDQFQTASLAGAAPEVVRVPSDFAGPFSALEIIAPVDQLFDQAFIDQSFPGAYENSKVAGTYWGVPDGYGNHLMLIYNKSLIAEPPATFEELVTKAKELTTGDIQGFAYNQNEPYWGAGFYGAFGGWPLDENDAPQFNNESFINYLKFVSQLKTDGVIPDECNYDCADVFMKDGKAAMIINGDWSLGGYTEALGDNLGVAPVPSINGNPYTEMTGNKTFMFSNAVLDDEAKKQAVVKLVTYMTSPEVQKLWLDQFKRLPSNIEVAKDPSIASDPILAGSMAALSNGRGQPAAPQMRCAWDAWRPNLEGVMAGTLTAEDAAASAQTSADECVATLK